MSRKDKAKNEEVLVRVAEIRCLMYMISTEEQEHRLVMLLGDGVLKTTNEGRVTVLMLCLFMSIV